MSGLQGIYQIQEVDYVDANSSGSWTTIGTGTITHRTLISDSEANWELEHQCYEIGVVNINDGISIPYASWKDVTYAPGTAGQYPYHGLWVRASTTGAVIRVKIIHTDATEISNDITIATANKWKFEEYPISAGNGKTASSFQVWGLSAGITIWVARMQFVNQSRVLSGVEVPSATDERMHITGKSYMSWNASRTYERCYIFNTDTTSEAEFHTYTSTMKSVMGKGGYFYKWYGSGLAYFQQSASKNLFSGSTYNISLGASLGISMPNSAHQFTYIKFYGSGITFTFGTTINNPTWDKIYIYGGEVYGSVASIVISNINFVGGTYAFRVYFGSVFRIFNCSISTVNSPTYHLYSNDYAGAIFWFEHSTVLNTAKISLVGNVASLSCVWIFKGCNFITNPITAGIRVIGKGSIVGYENNYPSTYNSDITDANGKITLWSLAEHRSYNGGLAKDFSTPTSKWTFYFLNTLTNQIVATYVEDISNGIGTPSSPVTVPVSSGVNPVRFDGGAFT